MLARLSKELQLLLKNDEFKIKVKEEDLRNLKATMKGPKDTIYEGGEFSLEIQVPEEYPFKPPKIRFVTPILHPNVH